MSRRAAATALVGALALVDAGGRSASAVPAAPRMVWSVSDQARGQPDTDGRAVYFLTRMGEVVALDALQGRARWRAPLGSEGNGPVPGIGSRVVVAGSAVVAGGYDLAGLDATNGRRMWTFAPHDGYGFGFYLARGGPGGVVYAGSATGGLYAIDAGTGRVHWQSTIGSPDTTVYTPSWTGSSVAVAFTEFGARFRSGLAVVDRETGEERWRRDWPRSHEVPAVVVGGPVFAGSVVIASGYDGTIHAFDRDTGDVRWSIPARADQVPDLRPLVVSDGLLIAGSTFGEVVAYDVATQRQRWRSRPGRDSVAFELVEDEASVYVPYVSGTLVSLATADGRERWRLGGGRWGFGWPPRLSGSRMYLAGSVTGFLAYSLTDPPGRETKS